MFGDTTVGLHQTPKIIQFHLIVVTEIRGRRMVYDVSQHMVKSTLQICTEKSCQLSIAL